MSRASITQLTRRAILAYTTLFGFVRPAITAVPGRALARVRPGEAEWPAAEDWRVLSRAVGGCLHRVRLPEPTPAPALLSNPFFLRDQAGLTQSSGWVDAWRSAPSTYVVRARNAADVSAAIRFATHHNLRLVVKGGGHSYLGGSNAPDSLLVWTRDMEAIDLHDAFVPKGSSLAPTPAVSVGAGCIWGHVYQAVTTQGGRFVQGGGCTTVGVAGLVQGGGFGSFSKNFGLAAASLLEAEIVTADGVVLTVNEAQEPDLFWALKGGGGGTFGVVTRLTLRTHDLPVNFGVVHWSVTASSDAAFGRLLKQFVELYAQHLYNPHWGEQASARPGNRFEVLMLFQGLDEKAALDAWTPLTRFVAENTQDYHVVAPFLAAAFPARQFWNETFLRAHLAQVIASDERPDAAAGDWWWSGNTGEAGTFWHGYQSAWLPASLLAGEAQDTLAMAWFDASRHWSMTLHFNKGLAGAPASALAASRQTAMNPQVLDAFALAISADDGPSAFGGLPEAALPEARRDGARIKNAMTALRKAAPDAGSYLSECDYGLDNWQKACWGDNWSRLSEVKARYDPHGLFVVHHGVGSEHWSSDGFVRVMPR
jgi:FAD/FMN-containing dehydrogenase